MSNQNSILDNQEVTPGEEYERGYSAGTRRGVVLGFLFCLLLFGGGCALQFGA